MENIKHNLMAHVLISIITILSLAVLYLLYQNRMAEDMIEELNRDYEELAASICQGRDGK